MYFTVLSLSFSHKRCFYKKKSSKFFLFVILKMPINIMKNINLTKFFPSADSSVLFVLFLSVSYGRKELTKCNGLRLMSV